MIILGGNPKAILESSQNIFDAYPLMDPNEYYTGVALVLVPPKTSTGVPTPVITPTPVQNGSVTPSNTLVTVSTPVPVQTTVPSGRSGFGLSPVSILILLAGLIVAGIAGAFLIVRRKKEGGMPGVVQITTRAAGRLKNAVSGITLIPRTKEEEEKVPGTVSITSKAAAALKKVVADRSRSPSPMTMPAPRTFMLCMKTGKA